MTTLTSALNYAAFITLSCCNALLQIAAAPACIDPARDSFWPSCAPDGSVAGADLRRQVFKPGRVTRMVMAPEGGARFFADFHDDGRLDLGTLGGNPDTGREWRLDGDRVCLHYDPGSRPETECAAVEIHRGKLYLVAGAGQRRPVDSIEWRAG